MLRFVLWDDRGAIEGAGEFTREELSELTYIPGTSGNFDLELLQGDRSMMLRSDYQPGPLVQSVTGIASIAGERLMMRITLGAVPISAVEVLMILLPVMMWIFAAIIGWIILDGQSQPSDVRLHLVVGPLIEVLVAADGIGQP